MGSPLFSLSGKTAILTGATRGIGRAIAVGFAQAGANIILLQVQISRIQLLILTAGYQQTRNGIGD